MSYGDPNTRLPDSRHPNGAIRDLPELFNFTKHGMRCPGFRLLANNLELSIAPDLNSRLIPPHARAALAKQGLDIDNFTPMTKEEMSVRLD